jgi:hypothetical protein
MGCGMAVAWLIVMHIVMLTFCYAYCSSIAQGFYQQEEWVWGAAWQGWHGFRCVFRLSST